MGILDPDNNRHGAKEFRERITAVVFIPEKEVNLFDKAFLLMNVCRSEHHLQAFWSKLKNIPVLGKLRCVALPGEWKI